MEHCELPTLPGQGPLGGEILSHDFVEAALMRRAGWKVCTAHDLDSYEECPATILGFAQRDQRWCQGNLQHLRLILAEGLHPASRLHLGMGAMSFLASPLWFAFLMLTVIAAIYGGNVPAADFHWPGGLVLFGATMSLLLLPKLWSVIATARHPTGAGRLRTRALASVLMETLVSMLIAPIMMLLHTRFVISTLLGKKVTWEAQEREDRGVTLREAFLVHVSHTLAGLIIAGVAWLWTPDLLPWLLPVLAGLVFSVPLAMLLGSVKVGRFLWRKRLLTIPEEANPPPVVQYQRNALAVPTPQTRTTSDPKDIFTSVLQDPAFYALHVGILRATESDLPVSQEQLEQLKGVMSAGPVGIVPAELRRAILSDSRAMEHLHVQMRTRLRPAHSVLLV
jgi:membrane glycosyltransferase